jgi:RNA polymerase sigma factor (sigma-70 family)
MKEKEKRELFNQVYQDNKELIFRLCRGFLGPGPEAEDLFQEIFLKVWNNLESFRGQSKVSTWIYRIGTNTALLYRKRKARRQNREAPLLNTATDQPHTVLQIWKKRSATTGNWMHSFSSFNRLVRWTGSS